MTVKVETADQFGTAKIGDLVPSKDNPRKSFREQPLKDLVESIKEKGVLTPLLVRRHKGKLEILAGERRFKASKEAGLDKVPVQITEVNDNTAFELMVIENLQRDDVHPMDEAKAFSTLYAKLGVEQGGWKNDDPADKPFKVIAEKTGKTAAYVKQNIQLTSLIPKAMEYFYEDVLTVEHALLICKLSEKDQEKILSEKIMSWGETYAKPLPEWKQWVESSTTRRLSMAPFDLNDEKLFEPAGACATCSKNTKCNVLLFDDMQDADAMCTDRECFKTKIRKHLTRERNKLKDKGTDFLDGGYENGYYTKGAQVKIQGQEYKIQKKKDCKKPLAVLIRSHNMQMIGVGEKSLVGTVVYIEDPRKNSAKGSKKVEVKPSNSQEDWEKKRLEQERANNKRHYIEANIASHLIRQSDKKAVVELETVKAITGMLGMLNRTQMTILGFALEAPILKDLKDPVEAASWHTGWDEEDKQNHDDLFDEIVNIVVKEYSLPRFYTIALGLSNVIKWNVEAVETNSFKYLLEREKVDPKKLAKAFNKDALAYAKKIENEELNEADV